MAIFGTFFDMPLPDVLCMIGRGSGTFRVYQPTMEIDCELFIRRGAITKMMVSGEDRSEPSQINAFMVSLLKDNMGEFEFNRIPPDEIDGDLKLPLEQVLMNSLVAVDELNALQAHLPAPETRFQVVQGAEAGLDGSVLDFWSITKPWLFQGISGKELADCLGLTLDNVLVNLYKVRAAGLIEPIREFRPKTVDEKSPRKIVEPQAEATVTDYSFPESSDESGGMSDVYQSASNLEPTGQPEHFAAPTPSVGQRYEWTEFKTESSSPVSSRNKPQPRAIPVLKTGLSSVKLYKPNYSMLARLMDSLKHLTGKLNDATS